MSRQLPESVRWVWNARWGNYWLGDREVLEFRPADFDRKARDLNRAGINAVITFGFHFRWGFVNEWALLSKTLEKICASCHRHGIKVVEHHSSILTSNPSGEKEWMMMSRKYDNDSCPVDVRRHPEMLRTMEQGDAEYRGIKLSSLRQIDPRTGCFARSNYQGWAFCFNNPDWQRLYFEYLEKIYACGVDGIMTDDIQFWPPGYGCGCLHCRRLFESETNYRLPPAGNDDQNFYGNFENPAYRAWILWRIDCHRKHQARLFRHFRGKGLELARPIYCSSNTNSYTTVGTGMSLDDLDGLYTAIFTEVNTFDVQAHCWLRTAAESSQRSALARRNRVPAMCLFHPHNEDENLFCWGMTKLWGQNYYYGANRLPSSRKAAGIPQGPFRFESSHSELYHQPESAAEVGVLFSSRTVWLHRDTEGKPDPTVMSDPASTDCWAGWCELLMLNRVPFDTLMDRDLADERVLKKYKLLIVPNAVCMSDRETMALKSYVAAGGRLIITHQSGLKDETGKWRKRHPLARMMGVEYHGVEHASPDWTAVGEKYGIKRCRAHKTPIALWRERRGMETWMYAGKEGRVAVGRNRYGKGEAIAFAGKPGRIICINRQRRYERNGKRYAHIDYNMDKNVTALMMRAVHDLYREPLLRTDHVPFGIVTGLYRHDDRQVLHVMNAAGVLADSGKEITIPSKLAFPSPERLPGGGREMEFWIRTMNHFARLYSPNMCGPQTLDTVRDGRYLLIRMPSSLLCCYQAIEIY
ncbi:MAG: beta-galactosidase trimerization domain-containing protein [Kiritimatiellae bacterium]|nr:beta-galactosidase trimerization domain-containing protein [Kiritimatiellia bacterium]